MRTLILTLCLGSITFLSNAQQKTKTEFGDKFISGWERHKVYTLRLAEAMDEKDFVFKPEEGVRSFAEIVLHITTANYMFSSVALKKDFPLSKEEQSIEGKSKADLVKMLGDSFDYASETIMNITVDQLKLTTPWGNPIEESTTRTSEEVLHVMREHAAHHRGQMGVYLRLKGVNPPGYID